MTYILTNKIKSIFKNVVESGKPFNVSEKDFTYAEHPERDP
ncbi:MAG: hypothetical protein ACFE8P_02400 [Promethearchaeota archaeon]